jgi:4,5-DOPA dioxygenase extradiol
MDLTRRAFLACAATTGGLAALGRVGDALADAPAPSANPAPAPPKPSRIPAIFVGHGSPMTALDAAKGGEWTRWAATLPWPKAILAVSAHWEQAPTTIGATTTVPLVYDFYGFPRALYDLTYPAPPAPALADAVEARLRPLGPVRRDPRRGHDHGAWCPLRWLYPKADVPVLSISMPTQDASRLLAMGRALAPLRDEGVLVCGSGNLVHNLRALGRDGAPTPSWAKEFDDWTAAAIAGRDVDGLSQWQARAPGARQSHPTVDHFDPVLVTLGAGLDSGDVVRFPIAGFEAGSVSRRCVQIG